MLGQRAVFFVLVPSGSLVPVGALMGSRLLCLIVFLRGLRCTVVHGTAGYKVQLQGFQFTEKHVFCLFYEPTTNMVGHRVLVYDCRPIGGISCCWL